MDENGLGPARPLLLVATAALRVERREPINTNTRYCQAGACSPLLRRCLHTPTHSYCDNRVPWKRPGALESPIKALPAAISPLGCPRLWSIWRRWGVPALFPLLLLLLLLIDASIRAIIVVLAGHSTPRPPVLAPIVVLSMPSGVKEHFASSFSFLGRPRSACRGHVYGSTRVGPAGTLYCSLSCMVAHVAAKQGP